MKLFIDLEFNGLHQHTDMISVACITEYEDTFYGVSTDFDFTYAIPFVKENVKSNLVPTTCDKLVDPNKTHAHITDSIFAIRHNINCWLDSLSRIYPNDNTIEVWTDVGQYDYVLFAELFGGGALALPPNFYYIPFDIATVFRMFGIDPDTNRDDFAPIQEEHRQKHNALYDAIVLKKCFDRIKALAPTFGDPSL